VVYDCLDIVILLLMGVVLTLVVVVIALAILLTEALEIEVLNRLFGSMVNNHIFLFCYITRFVVGQIKLV